MLAHISKTIYFARVATAQACIACQLELSKSKIVIALAGELMFASLHNLLCRSTFVDKLLYTISLCKAAIFDCCTPHSTFGSDFLSQPCICRRTNVHPTTSQKVLGWQEVGSYITLSSDCFAITTQILGLRKSKADEC